MEEFEIISTKVDTIKSLRDCIVDNDLYEDHTIILNPDNFDSIVLEHRKVYGKGIDIPFTFLGVLVKEDRNVRLQRRQIGVIKHIEPEE